jgi:histidinol-phosphate aminotransferase
VPSECLEPRLRRETLRWREADPPTPRTVSNVTPEPSSRVAGIPIYRQGRSADAVAAEHGLAEAIKLASNESPFGPLPGVADAVAASITSINRYADHTATAVAERYAEQIGVDRERVAVGAGSVGLIEQLALSFVGQGDRVVYPWPSFIAYPQFTSLAGGVAVNPPLRRQAFDIDAFVAAITDETRLVLIANPNNPTGTAVRTADLQRIVAAAPGNCLVVIDEAYHEFVTGADVPDALESFGDRPNVAVLRTLSKAYGLAGLRIGFMVADPTVVDAVNASSLPFAVNAAAQAAALAALEQGDEVTRRCAVLTGERTRVAQELRRRGLGMPDSQANFWWLAAGRQSVTLAAELERRGVVTRPLDGGVRVSVGTPVENELFLQVLADVANDIDLAADWDGATGDAAAKASAWLDRLDAAMARFRDHLRLDHPGRTAPVPGEEETWDAGQVWAHVAEFGDFWLEQLDTIFREPAATDPVPFGRTRRDAGRIAAIEAGRNVDPAAHLGTVERSADRLAAMLAGMTSEDWSRTGKHETLGVMDLDAQLTHFHVGHYEEHADQLDSIAGSR